MLRTRSRGLDTNILEIKTWIFTPSGTSVVNICHVNIKYIKAIL